MEPDVIPAQKVISHLPTLNGTERQNEKSYLVNTAVTH